MRTKERHSRKKDRRSSGRPPRWLVLGAVATTAFGAQAAQAASVPRQGRPSRSGDFAERYVAARRDDLDGLSLGYGETTLLALLDTLDREAATAADRKPVRRGATTVALEIPPGPLGVVLKALEEASGLELKIEQDVISDLPSPGVRGELSLSQALERALAGTGVSYRFTAEREVTLQLEYLTGTVDVIEPGLNGPASPKYTEPIRDIPQSLTVVPQRLFEEQNATTLRDVLRNVTGISIQAGEGGGGIPGDSLSIRGFSATNDIFIDGVRDFGAYSRDPYNVEQVEVSKGPASLYSGHGSTGGSVNLVSKTPRLRAEQSGTLGIGTDSFGRATVDVNQPIEGGLPGMALRVNGMWSSADTPGRDEVENRRWGISPSLAIGLGTPTRLTVSYSRLDQDNLPEYGIPWVPVTNVPLARFANQAAPVDFDNFYGLVDRDYEKTVTDLATLTLDHELSDSLSLRSLVRQGTSKRDSVITAPRFLSNDGTDLTRQLQSRDLTNEILAQQNNLTAKVTSGRFEHSLIAGTEISRETGKNFARTGPTAPVADLFNPDPHAPYAGPIVRTGAYTESIAKTSALYASDTVKLSERWQITGGLRWDRFDVEYHSIATTGEDTPFDRTDESLSWRAGVVAKPHENGSVYLSAGTSFNPSSEGTTGLSLTASTADLKPEENRGVELGTKWDFAGSRLSVSAALFQTEKTNAKTPGVNPGDPVTVLDGEQRIRGLELGLVGSLTPSLSAFFGYTYLDSEIVKSNNPLELGREFANAPEHSASLWMTYRLPRGFELGGGAQYVGDRTNSTTTVRLAPSYTLFDATVGWELNERFSLRLNLNNLADERYIDRVGGGHFVPGAGRSAALTTGLKF